jgi:phosphoribosyl-AMP cyclohydrolase
MATFWSTSRNELWIKGKTSGDFLEIIEICVNCEQNSLLYRVRPKGKGACHTKNLEGIPRSGCYYRSIKNNFELEFK